MDGCREDENVTITVSNFAGAEPGTQHKQGIMSLINQLFKGRDAVRETDYTKMEPSLKTPQVADDGGGDGGNRSYTYRPGGGEGVKPTRETSFPREARRRT